MHTSKLYLVSIDDNSPSHTTRHHILASERYTPRMSLKSPNIVPIIALFFTSQVIAHLSNASMHERASTGLTFLACCLCVIADEQHKTDSSNRNSSIVLLTGAASQLVHYVFGQSWMIRINSALTTIALYALTAKPTEQQQPESTPTESSTELNEMEVRRKFG